MANLKLVTPSGQYFNLERLVSLACSNCKRVHSTADVYADLDDVAGTYYCFKCVFLYFHYSHDRINADCLDRYRAEKDAPIMQR